MKKTLASLLLLSATALLASCSFVNNSSSITSSGAASQADTATTSNGVSTSTNLTSSASNTVVSSASQTSISVPTISVADTGNADGLSIVTEDGNYAISGSTVTISSAGTYTLSGELNGMIYVDAGDEDEVTLELSGLTVVNANNSPIFINNASEVKIKAVKNTENYISDQRSVKTTEAPSQGEGAIYSVCDLKLTGTGSLVVLGSYNNGIHGKDDVEIKNQTLTVSAPNHAVRGNDSITIEEGGTFYFYGQGGDGLHTENTGLTSKNKQQGSITITGGTVNLYSAGDGIDAAYDAIIAKGTDSNGVETSPTVNIYTNKMWDDYSGAVFSLSETVTATETISYIGRGGTAPGTGGGGGGGPWGGTTIGGSTNSNKAADSAKGIKAGNQIQVSAGSLSIASYDDGLHADYGNTLESGGTGVGDILIQGGTLAITASDDGIHADRSLKISDGNLNISAYEGLEGNQIVVSGGTSYVYGTDDGINATSGSLSETKFEISGGYVFCEVSSNGDTDGLDSNGNVYIKGGTMIACGPNSQMAAALDYEGRASVTGGSLILIGAYESAPSTSGVTASRLSASYSPGSAYKLTFSNGTVTTGTMKYSHSGTTYAYSALGSLSSVAKN